MTLQVVSAGYRTVLFTDKPNGPPKVDEIPAPVKFSAERIAASEVPPTTVYAASAGKIEEGPIHPISDTPPPPEQ
jgi:hypothetical protein